MQANDDNVDYYELAGVEAEPPSETEISSIIDWQAYRARA
jgi:hypothetical protein